MEFASSVLQAAAVRSPVVGSAPQSAVVKLRVLRPGDWIDLQATL